ncbi:MAG: hypothetical protein IJE43_01575 [Alphaproteobacteria bacterium]|nr:hypothetical protein [Alphaproteobacteria bacterium]
MKELTYCTKCGETNDFCEKKCSFCSSVDFLPVPEKYVSYIADVVPILNKDLKNEFIEEVVKKSPNFDQNAFDKIPQIIAARKEINEIVKVEMKESNLVPKCITCGSTNIKKISVTSKAGSVALWGIFSQKVKKQFHCNSCGYEW